MNLRRIARRILGGGCEYHASVTTQHHDPDLGSYQFFPADNGWTHRRPFDAGELVIRGRSEHPTLEQKRLLEVFWPLLSSLTREALDALEVPKGYTDSDMPKLLTLREVRFEATGDVELFFDPRLEINGYEAWPYATCSSVGQLQSVYWTV